MVSKRGLLFGGGAGLLVAAGTGAVQLFVIALVSAIAGRGDGGEALVTWMTLAAVCYAAAAFLVGYAAASQARAEPAAATPPTPATTAP